MSERQPQVYDAESIRRAIGFEDLIDPVEQVFADFSRGLGESPITVFAPAGDEGDVHVKSAWMPGRSVFTVKAASWFAARAVGGRSGSTGWIAVHDATTGDLLALMLDEHHITDVRTAAAGAVATRLLAREDARTLAVLGTGVQAYLQVLAICAVRTIEQVVIWGRRGGAARTLRAAFHSAVPSLNVSVTDQARLAVRQADVVVTATGSKEPILEGSWLRPGQHVTAVGADDPTKAELDPACFQRADLVVVDSRANAPRFAGDLCDAIDAGVTAIDAEIGELVLGSRPGRRNPEQITIAKLIGLGILDLAAAETTLRLLRDGEPAQRRRPPASALDIRRYKEAES